MLINALSIDLEDWYHSTLNAELQLDRWPTYEDRIKMTTDHLLAILDEADVRATFFILGYVAEHSPDLIRKIAAAGHEIGAHGYAHRLVYRLTPEEFRQDLVRGRDAIEQAAGRRVYGYRAPYFSINKTVTWAFEILHELGFLYDSSVFPVKNTLYGYPTAPRAPYYPIAGNNFIELPLSTLRLAKINIPIAGGFYMRLYPYSFFKWGIKRVNKENLPFVFYMHPWELDPQNPSLKTTRLEHVVKTFNVKSSVRKLKAMLRDFQFAPICELLNSYPMST